MIKARYDARPFGEKYFAAYAQNGTNKNIYYILYTISNELSSVTKSCNNYCLQKLPANFIIYAENAGF